MISRKSYLVLAVFLFLFNISALRSQVNNIGIAINEYCAANINGPVDNFGILSDWVEIINVDPSPVSLNGYWLSNDRLNPKKWAFPNGFTLQPGEIKVIWLSGRVGNGGGAFHANFTIDQCKNQWLVLSPPGDGIPRDSTIVRPMQAGHSWGRISYEKTGLEEFRLYTQPSFMQQNSLLNFNLGYHPKPTLVPVGATTFTPAIDTLSSLNPGFFNETGQIFKIKVNGVDYDTTTFKCFDIYYTLGGDHPNPSNWTRYFEPLNSLITIAKTDVIRVIAVSSTVQTCPQGVLPSFVETNTYFVDVPHQTFDERFGVMSISLDQADKFWFASQGVPASTTVHVEYYDKKKQVSEGYAIINRPPHESWANKQKGFYISLDDRYGFGCSFEGPIFNCKQLGVSTRTNFPTVHLKSGDFEAYSPLDALPTKSVEGTAMRDVLMQSLVALNDIKISALHIKPVITFVNGKYWGVYNLTEVFDKFYENFYNGQPLDQLDMNYYYNGDATVSYPDGSISSFKNDFKSTVYNVAIGGPLTQASRYNQLMASLDKESFMDYMILNNYAMNTDLFNFNMAFAKGGNAAKPGSKWHYYLWNTPSVFNFTAVATNTLIYGTHVISPCYLNTLGGYLVSPRAHNGHGKILTALFNANTGNPNFKLEYRTRYVDLINGPLRCENILRQFDTIRALYEKEMLCHMDAGCAAGVPEFSATDIRWDTLMTNLRKKISSRCFDMEKIFANNLGSSCFGRLTGPNRVSVDVRPAGSGKVKLNTLNLESYPWVGNYYSSFTLNLIATPSNTNYVFDHWELEKTETALNSTVSSNFSVTIGGTDNFVAVFTDITNPVNASGEGANVPNAFTPNDDGLNDYFRPLGSGKYVNEYQMTIWNRWGQEVFRSTDPKATGWDGNFKGEKAPVGVYAYIITYRNVNGESKIAKGNVTLTR